MVAFLEGILRYLPADFVTNVIVLLIIVIFILAVVFNSKGKHSEFTSYAPVMLTSIGILGTFLGISIGLINFDSNNINDSISELLDGMKTAFFTSLAGMGFSIIFKIVQHFTNKHDDIDTQDVDVADILRAMNKQQESLASLLVALGDGDTSILSQLKFLRGDINDNNKIQQNTNTTMQNQFKEFVNTLWIKLQDFADILSKSATETIIEALRQVIIDFNKNLTEQFGENFKELNNAVTELVTWQENYKKQMEQMTEQYRLSVATITTIEVAVHKISENTQAIPPTMDVLGKIMEVNQQQLSELAQHLTAFEEMKNRAVEAIPTINQQIDRTVNSIAASVESATTHYNKLVEDTGLLQESVITNIEGLQKHLEVVLEEVFKTNIKNMQDIDTGLKTQVEKTGQAVETQLNLIDQSMQEELTRVMNAMGQALGRISNQFVNDYSRLVEQMNSVISTKRS